MKLKLIYLVSIISYTLHAQINVNVDFNNNIFPQGWSRNGYGLGSANGCLATGGMVKQHSQASPGGSFSTSNYTSNGNEISFSVDYMVTSSNSGTVHVTVSYQINNVNFTVLSNGSSGQTNGCVSLNFTIPAGTVPQGSQIKFNFEGFRQSLTTNLAFDNIRIIQTGEASISEIAYYPFNNTYTDSDWQNAFSSSGTQFVQDRNGNPNSALRITSTTVPSTATIANLPIGNAARTVSFWVKINNNTGNRGIFTYGTNASLQLFGFYLVSNGNSYFQAFGLDHNFGGFFPSFVWKYVTLTFDSAKIRLYIDGQFSTTSVDYNLNTGNTIGFRLGGNGAEIEFDDLRIYNGALTNTQIQELFTNNSLSVENLNLNQLKIALHPNPVTNVFTIETQSEIKKIEVYNMHGQKIATSTNHQVDMSTFSKGVYMVKVQDVNNAINNEKIIKN